MAIAYVQGVSARAASATSVTTGGINTTTGNLAVATCGYYLTDTFSSVTDNGTSNTWSTSISEYTGTNWKARELYCNSINGKSGHTFTLTVTMGLGYPTLMVREISGQTTGVGPDKTSSGQAIFVIANTDFDGPDTATTTQAAEMLLGSCWDDDSSFRSQTLSCSSPWTQDEQLNHNATYYGFVGGHRTVSATGAYHFTAQSTVGGGAGDNRLTFLLSTWKEAAAAAFVAPKIIVPRFAPQRASRY